MAKCPHCKSVLEALKGTTTTCNTEAALYHAVVYSCPTCDSVLSCQIDPIAIQADIVNGIVGAMERRGLSR